MAYMKLLKKEPGTTVPPEPPGPGRDIPAVPVKPTTDQDQASEAASRLNNRNYRPDSETAELSPVRRHARKAYLPIHPTDLARNPTVRLRAALLLGVVLTSLGTAGYMLIGRYNLLDAVYMTVITLSTVGYETIKPLDPPTKAFTVLFILAGIGSAAWVFTSLVEVFVSEATQQFFARKRMQRTVDNLSNHCIVCGFGRIGQQIAQGYTQDRVPFVVIEQAESRLAMLRESDISHVEGDAADDQVLIQAGIERAHALIAVTPTDAINTFIVLSAHGLKPDLFIIARADTIQNEAKLRRAGASRVISPHILGGRWMGITAINPVITDFIAAMTMVDDRQTSLREFQVPAASELAGKTFGEASLRETTGALVVAVRPQTAVHHFIPNPPDDLLLAPGDTLIAIGSPEQLSRMADLLKRR